jgi:16S rRNA (guanine(1405)-N(7))-methyltransferase
LTISASPDQRIESIEHALAASRRYATVAPSTVRRVAASALVSADGNVSDAVKRTKRGLHEIFGAFLPLGQPNYATLVKRLQEAVQASDRTGDDEAVRTVLRQCLAIHASSRERLPCVAEFYREVFRRIPTPAVVRDLACGFNPLAWAWMGLPANTLYLASDIDSRLIGFVGEALAALGVRHRAEVVDVLDGEAVPGEAADVTFILKTLPSLNAQQPGAGARVIAAAASPTVVVTFPTRSLGKRPKGMYQAYSSGFDASLAEHGWKHESWEIGNELIYLVSK